MWQQIFSLLASAARTVTGSGSDVATLNARDLGGQVRVYLDVTAAAGTTPTLDVRIQGKINGAYYTIGTFTQKTAAGRDSILIEEAPGTLRADWTIGGTTPSFTFEINCHRNGSRAA